MTLLVDTPPGAEGLVVQRCGLWGYNSIGVVSGDEACAVDPGITPEEVLAFRRALESGGRRVTKVVLTHSHHDHIRGWQAFEGAEVIAPSAVANKEAGPRERILAGKAKVDERLGVEDAGFQYPAVDRAFDDHLTVRVGALDLELEFLPGHSNCTSVVHVPALKALLTADYLVSPGLPYCRWEAAPFEAANRRLRELVTDHSVEQVIPAHNDLITGRAAALHAIDEELAYFKALRQDLAGRLDQGDSTDRAMRGAATFMAERRGVDLGPRARQDRDNARRVLAELGGAQSK